MRDEQATRQQNPLEEPQPSPPCAEEGEWHAAVSLPFASQAGEKVASAGKGVCKASSKPNGSGGTEQDPKFRRLLAKERNDAAEGNALQGRAPQENASGGAREAATAASPLHPAARPRPAHTLQNEAANSNSTSSSSSSMQQRGDIVADGAPEELARMTAHE